MINYQTKALYWRDFILARCQFPNNVGLEAQFAGAAFNDFCPCGCNSFGLTHNSDSAPQPIAKPGHGCMIFEADFLLSDGKTLEILLFVDDSGRLNFVEVDCVGNNFPVPDVIDVADQPYHVYASALLLL